MEVLNDSYNLQFGSALIYTPYTHKVASGMKRASSLYVSKRFLQPFVLNNYTFRCKLNAEPS